jgi:hypothetical protein
MPNLGVQEAIKKARNYVGVLFEEEPVTDIGLEEVEHDANTWKVTIGFNRIWKNPTNNALTFYTQSQAQRFFKVVTISDEDGALISVKNRDANQ